MTRIQSIEDADNSIYVLLTDTGTLFTTLIKRFTSAPYNHASLALDAGLNQLYSFGRKRPTNAWDAGFVEEDVYEGTYSCYPNTRCVLLRMRVSKQQRAEAIRVLQLFQRNREDYRYNLFGLLGVLVGLDFKRKNAYFCSQFVAEALAQSGMPLWERPAALVTPDDFFRHPVFEKIYEGCLYDYPLLGDRKASVVAASCLITA
ncbi:hypothetical protein COLU111180_07475 [Cohnella lubricantis]|uniref:Uncharacterized protein n=1 Tax=Cohnella lubricantis TaxID=2163172 RepID=A0A841TLA5_9BACL|nr:hypothetical protein [Cohnella lubricantis]MBB6679331.1 hypothetical protein [Cohnella lubricantis]MBP2120122.1 hypothetical protein [Cohnella lubricantis]